MSPCFNHVNVRNHAHNDTFHDLGNCCHFNYRKSLQANAPFFPYVVSYSHFVELEKEVVIPLAMFIKKVLLGKCTDIIFVDRTPLQERKNYRIHIHKAYSLAELQVLSRGRHLWFVVFQWFLLTVFTRFRQVHKKVTFCRAKGRLLKGEKPCLASRKAII